MGSNRGIQGRKGIAGNVNIALEKEDGSTTPLPADDQGLLISKMFGQDSNDNDRPIATDQQGRLKVKDIQFDGTVDIGDLQILDSGGAQIDPATEGTLSDIETNTADLGTESTLTTIEANTSGLATEQTLSTIESNTSGIAQESTLSSIETNTNNNATEGTLSDIETNTADLGTESTLTTIEANTSGLFKPSDFTETRIIEQNNAGLFEASDFTETRNVRELQNEGGIATGKNTGGGSLTSQAVPDGKTVRVQALQGNGSKIEINGDFELVPGQAVDLGVDNVSKISYTAGAGDGVCWIVEA